MMYAKVKAVFPVRFKKVLKCWLEKAGLWRQALSPKDVPVKTYAENIVAYEPINSPAAFRRDVLRNHLGSNSIDIDKNAIAVVCDFTNSNPVGALCQICSAQYVGDENSFADTQAMKWLYNPILKSLDNFNECRDSVLEAVRASRVTHVHLELGLFGNSLDQMTDYIHTIIGEAHALVVFIHSLHMHDESFAPTYDGILQALEAIASKTMCKIWVNNPKDYATVRKYLPIENIVYYPVLYFGSRQKQFFIRRGALMHESANEKSELTYTVGVFGFINTHKDFATTIKALALLPQNYRLAIVGGAHPAERQVNKKNDNIVALDDLIWQFRDSNLHERITFYDGLGDREFFTLMASLDAVIVNYLETQMSASSVLSQALELEVPVIASRCTTLEVAQEHFGKSYEFFDPGNSIQLRQKIVSCCETIQKQPKITCTLEEFSSLIAL